MFCGLLAGQHAAAAPGVVTAREAEWLNGAAAPPQGLTGPLLIPMTLRGAGVGAFFRSQHNRVRPVLSARLMLKTHVIFVAFTGRSRGVAQPAWPCRLNVARRATPSRVALVVQGGVNQAYDLAGVRTVGANAPVGVRTAPQNKRMQQTKGGWSSSEAGWSVRSAVRLSS